MASNMMDQIKQYYLKHHPNETQQIYYEQRTPVQATSPDEELYEQSSNQTTNQNNKTGPKSAKDVSGKYMQFSSTLSKMREELNRF
jgi:hypothetical protein